MNRYVAIGLFSILVLLGLSGCNLRNHIDVDMPKDVLNAIGRSNVTLSTSDIAVSEWKSYVENRSKEMEMSIHDAQERYAFIESVTNIGVGLARDSAGSFPLGGILLSILTGAVGVALPQPRFIKGKEAE